MKICVNFVENCDQPEGTLISFTFLYYLIVTIVVLIQLTATKNLFLRLPNNRELLVLKALTFSSFQVICFNIAGIWEASDNVHAMFRVVILAFQIFSIILLNILMIIAFYEVTRARKYGDMEADDEIESRRESVNDGEYLKIKFAFIVFGMLYSAIIVIGIALICDLYMSDPSIGFKKSNEISYRVIESDSIDGSF